MYKKTAVSRQVKSLNELARGTNCEPCTWMATTRTETTPRVCVLDLQWLQQWALYRTTRKTVEADAIGGGGGGGGGGGAAVESDAIGEQQLKWTQSGSSS